jgi:hypothetical protein
MMHLPTLALKSASHRAGGVGGCEGVESLVDAHRLDRCGWSSRGTRPGMEAEAAALRNPNSDFDGALGGIMCFGWSLHARHDVHRYIETLRYNLSRSL